MKAAVLFVAFLSFCAQCRGYVSFCASNRLSPWRRPCVTSRSAVKGSRPELFSSPFPEKASYGWRNIGGAGSANNRRQLALHVMDTDEANVASSEEPKKQDY